MADENSWRTHAFRQSVIAKIDEAIRQSGMNTSRNSVEMENHVFLKAKNKEEYLGFVARLILHVREMKPKQGGGMAGPGQGQVGPGMPDPINALQNLASQGSRNPMINMGPQPGQLGGPQQPTATNLLQTLNRGPGQQMMMGNMPGNMPGNLPMQDKREKNGINSVKRNIKDGVDILSDNIRHEIIENDQINVVKAETGGSKVMKGMSQSVVEEKQDNNMQNLKRKFYETGIYKNKLKILKLERELDLPPSKYTMDMQANESDLDLTGDFRYYSNSDPEY